jgi:hypothetical protein
MFRKIKISPEVIKQKVFDVTYDGEQIGYYSGMTEVLSGGTNGASYYTGMTVPIYLTKNVKDLGFYSEFDGFILQKDVLNNFVMYFSSNPYVLFVKNTSDVEFKSFLKDAPYVVDWGDGTTVETFVFNETTNSFDVLSHTYPNTNLKYVVKITQQNQWGTSIVEKTIQIPYYPAPVPNPTGTIYFVPNSGSWSGIPINAQYIFTEDSNFNASSEFSSNFVATPFVISGETKSRINELRRYGSNKYPVGQPLVKNSGVYGQINSINPLYTSYTIEGVDYYDYPNGQTIFFINSSGLDSNNLQTTLVTKDERLIGFVSQPEIQSNVFIERDKASGLESLERLGEVDNLGDLSKYGYKYFKLNKDGIR